MPAQIANRVRVLLTLAILAVTLYLLGVTWSFLSQFAGTFMLFFLAWLLAYVLKPLIKLVARTGLPLVVAMILVYIVVPALVVLAGFFLVPVLTDQITQISSHLGEYTGSLSGLVDYAKGALSSIGASEADIAGLESKIREVSGGLGQTILSGGLGTLSELGNQFFRFTLIIIFSTYFVLDGDNMAAKVSAALPVSWRAWAALIAKSIETSFGSFVRGELFSALAYAIMNALVMMAFGLPNVALGSLLAGLLILVPLVGNYLAYLPALLICLVARSDAALILFLVLVIMQALYMNLVSPRIMAKAVNIHPLLTMASILVFGQLLGFWGALFGIPIASTLSMLAKPTLHLIHNYMNPDEAPEPTPQLILPASASQGTTVTSDTADSALSTSH